MEHIVLYVVLFGIIVLVGQIFHKTTIPISLLLVITGMLLSSFQLIPEITFNPNIILHIFLPLLVYQISAFSSWKDVKRNWRPITLLSFGHVIFITVLIAYAIHQILPQLGWGLAFVLGAVIAPPDDVAIVSIAEKIRMPARIVTILEGEGLFNDAAALIIFRFALIAITTHYFSPVYAVGSFFLIILGETAYGIMVGFIMGELRSKITSVHLHVIASVLTPFIAYSVPVMLGGSGVLATVISGFIIGNRYTFRFSPEFRLVSRALWPSLAFTLQSILFLLVGLDLRSILDRISTIPAGLLMSYALAVVGILIIGRFFWVYVVVYFLPRLVSKRIRRYDPLPPWQYPLILSWAGMRGGISLAAALAIPLMPTVVEGANARDLIIFLVFSAIVVTLLIQGLTLPWILKLSGATAFGRHEKYKEHVTEIMARLQMTKAGLQWLKAYRSQLEASDKLNNYLKLRIRDYRLLKEHLTDQLEKHTDEDSHDEETDMHEENCLLMQVIDIERERLMELWANEKIGLEVLHRLLAKLDHQARNLGETQ